MWCHPHVSTITFKLLPVVILGRSLNEITAPVGYVTIANFLIIAPHIYGKINVYYGTNFCDKFRFLLFILLRLK